MFWSKKKEETKVEPKVVERIVVIGNSVRTLYCSASIRLSYEYKQYPRAIVDGPTAKELSYHNKYWVDPAAPFKLGGKDVKVTQVQGVLADDGQAYLLDVSRVIKVEE